MQHMAQGAWGAMIADGNGRWRKACHVPRNFQNTWQAESQIHKSCRSYFSFRTLCSAQCALPAGGNVLCSLVNALHMEHGGETLLFPPCTPFSPVCCRKACGSQCGGMVPLPCGRLSGLRPLEPPASALLRRDKPGTETKWRCRNMPAGATRPLRARHRRASPRVLEFAQGSSARRIAE